MTARLLACLIMLAAMISVAGPARADYGWCATYSGMGGRNCGFGSQTQCLAAVRGIGGTCAPDPAYRGGRSSRARATRDDYVPWPSLSEIDRQYAWCAIMSGRGGGGGTNCGFSTKAQCMATISGIGGTCIQNPKALAEVAPPRKRKKY